MAHLRLRNRRASGHWSHDYIIDTAHSLAAVYDTISHDEFIAHLIANYPLERLGNTKRDIRKQNMVRAAERLIELNRFPYPSRGDVFIFT